MVVNVTSIVFFVTVLIFVAKASSIQQLFFYHPTSMVFGFGFLMTQGILYLTSNIYIFRFIFGESNRKSKVTIHFWMQVRPVTTMIYNYTTISHNITITPPKASLTIPIYFIFSNLLTSRAPVSSF